MGFEMSSDGIKQEEGMALSAPGSSASPASSNAGLPTPNSTAPKNSQTPSPSTSTSNANASSSASRRPPRKSTLTQQQKNQKRQRATQDQLTTLELEFNKNPTPTATVRERIAEEINMTERSVQIWFQNRRAKIKMMAKKSLETGEDINDLPESMRQYLQIQAMESGKGFGYFGGRTGLMPFGHQGALGGDGCQGKVLIHHLTCRSLAVGSWTRVGQNTMDLIIFYSPDKCTMTYYINSEQAGYKIEYPFAYIKSIFLDTTEGENGGITIELLNPPFFFMDSSAANGGFFACGDFTEDQQASRVLTHRLGGNPKVLSGQLAKLISLDAFMHRHSPPNPIVEQQFHPLSMSAPVSPTARPSSQPNFAQPHVGLFQETQWGVAHGAMMMRGPGHKRQRSRSVPGPIDFQTLQFLQQQPPSFHITQHESQAPTNGPQLFSPIPQQPNGMLGPMGPGLRIDTQATFGTLDMRQYPLSATTAPSPSDYSSPNFFATQGPDNGSIPAASFTPYSGTFSPLVNPSNLGVPPPSISPLSFNHQDPAIVGESPPTSMAPIYESSAVSDDGNSLSDMYQPAKHQITLPMHPHSPYVENQAELEINQFMDLKHFDVDPASLSPESVHQHA